MHFSSLDWETGTVLLCLMIFIFLISFSSVSAQEITPSFGGGMGTEMDPYLVETAKHLINIRSKPNSYYKQTQNIDLSGFNIKNYIKDTDKEGWITIFPVLSFNGIYDGNGYSIKNLTIQNKEMNGASLFGTIGSNSVLKNITLENVNISARNSVGALAGVNDSGQIINCHVEGSLEGIDFVGGLVGGERFSGYINKCSALIKVKGESKVGGLIGESNNEISQCWVKGEIIGDYNVGGISGENSGEIRKSFVHVEVSGGKRVGGITGINWGKIIDSYALGTVTGEKKLGGLSGELVNSSIRDCYASVEIHGGDSYYKGGIIGYSSTNYSIDDSYYNKDTANLNDVGTGAKNTADLKKKDSFAGWDFEEIWEIEEGKSYPYFQWQQSNIPNIKKINNLF